MLTQIESHARVTQESRKSHAARVTRESCKSHARVTQESRSESHARVTQESRWIIMRELRKNLTRAPPEEHAPNVYSATPVVVDSRIMLGESWAIAGESRESRAWETTGEARWTTASKRQRVHAGATHQYWRPVLERSLESKIQTEGQQQR